MSEPLERLFLRDKPVSALLAVGEMQPTYAAQVAKRIDSTFPHTCNILGELEAQGLLSSRPEGRIKYIELSDRGNKVVQAFRLLLDQLKSPGEGSLKLNRLEQILQNVRGEVGAAGGAESCMAEERRAQRLGPLRRDLARLMESEDESLRIDAEKLDADIAAIVCR